MDTNSEEFKIWWENYPKGNGFTYKGRKYKRTRALRMNEKKCEKKFYSILKEEKLTVEQMVDALRKEIKSRIQESHSSGVNKMTYMSNSYAYLNAGLYQAWMEDEEEVKLDEENKLIDPKDLF